MKWWGRWSAEFGPNTRSPRFNVQRSTFNDGPQTTLKWSRHSSSSSYTHGLPLNIIDGQAQGAFCFFQGNPRIFFFSIVYILQHFPQLLCILVIGKLSTFSFTLGRKYYYSTGKIETKCWQNALKLPYKAILAILLAFRLNFSGGIIIFSTQCYFIVNEWRSFRVNAL